MFKTVSPTPHLEISIPLNSQPKLRGLLNNVLSGEAPLIFSFLLGITADPREIENNAYAKFRGTYKVHYGRCASGVYHF